MNNTYNFKYCLEIGNDLFTINNIVYKNFLETLTPIHYAKIMNKYLYLLKENLVKLLDFEDLNTVCNFKSNSLNNNIYFLEHKEFIENKILTILQDEFGKENIYKISIYITKREE